jgi:pimeloyl-ACP methyl ester carboxylesterase
MPELRLRDVELFYEQSGDGPDIVWLAAGDNPGSNWRRFQTPAFDGGFRSTTYDARGVGATVSSSPPPWGIDEHAADCAALIEAVCDPPVSLVGLSMGSLIAVQPHDRPDLVARAIVNGHVRAQDRVHPRRSSSAATAACRPGCRSGRSTRRKRFTLVELFDRWRCGQGLPLSAERGGPQDAERGPRPREQTGINRCPSSLRPEGGPMEHSSIGRAVGPAPAGPTAAADSPGCERPVRVA